MLECFSKALQLSIGKHDSLPGGGGERVNTDLSPKASGRAPPKNPFCCVPLTLDLGAIPLLML